jgi:hypothetical protein
MTATLLCAVAYAVIIGGSTIIGALLYQDLKETK